MLFSPIGTYSKFQDELDSLFNGFGFHPYHNVNRNGFPAVNIYRDGDNLILHAEVPGADPEQIDISIKEQVLTLSGNRPQACDTKECKNLRQERTLGDFKRTFRLPFRVEQDKVEASYSKGILKVVLPRAEADKPKKIAVKTA